MAASGSPDARSLEAELTNTLAEKKLAERHVEEQHVRLRAVQEWARALDRRLNDGARLLAEGCAVAENSVNARASLAAHAFLNAALALCVGGGTLPAAA